MSKEKLQNFIKKTLYEIGQIKESDLIATKDDWFDMKTRFKNNVITLIQNIENDDYEDAKKVIGDTIGILRFWKGKIQQGFEREKNEKGYEDAFSKFDLKPNVLDEKNKD